VWRRPSPQNWRYSLDQHHVHSNVPDHVTGDTARLRQILVNLLSNAIKFTAHGTVSLEVDPEPQAGGEGSLLFSISDTGIGIPADRHEAIFTPFTQADGSTTRLYGGTGLGLSISSQLIDLMGGRIWVDSQVGKGSTFHFSVHLGPTRMGSRGEEEALQSLRGLRVLVVDDNAINRRVLAEILSRLGMEPILADGGSAALSRFQQAVDHGAPISLVLLDAMMPEMDGFDLAK
jgi:two-component system, sensor histidine kinase and response regulator